MPPRYGHVHQPGLSDRRYHPTRAEFTHSRLMTGHGKTAAALYFGCSIATQRNIGNIEVVQGEVVFLAGENPDDLCGRFHAACQFYGIDPATLPIRVMPGNFPLAAKTAETLKQTIDAGGRQTTLIIGDSAAAYFPGDDENHNVQMGDFARNLRVLTGCRGNPAVLILCHPIKGATKDNLLPRGGGAFLNEIDANLTLWAEAQGETSTLHWQGKIRGADFQPVNLSLNRSNWTSYKTPKAGHSYPSSPRCRPKNRPRRPSAKPPWTRTRSSNGCAASLASQSPTSPPMHTG